MQMDVFEKLNRTFGGWYEGLFAPSPNADLRPRDILRRILSHIEDERRDGLDGKVYVPNLYTIEVSPRDDDERHYLRAFLDAEELTTAVRHHLDQHGYQTRGELQFEIKEADASQAADADRLRIRSRFDASRAARPASRQQPPPDPDDEPPTVAATPRAFLLVPNAQGQQGTYPLTGGAFHIGRSRQAGNDLVLAGDVKVSKQHARIEYHRDHFFLHDLGSTNGTFLNGSLVDQPTSLQSDDEVRVGETRLLFRATKSGAFAGLDHRPPARRPAVARLVASGGEAFVLGSSMVVGQALTNDIVVSGDGIAARHAVVTLEEDRVRVEDLDTRGGTWVNGERIPPHFPVVLYPTDRVAFGSAAFGLEQDTQA